MISLFHYHPSTLTYPSRPKEESWLVSQCAIACVNIVQYWTIALVFFFIRVLTFPGGNEGFFSHAGFSVSLVLICKSDTSDVRSAVTFPKQQVSLSPFSPRMSSDHSLLRLGLLCPGLLAPVLGFSSPLLGCQIPHFSFFCLFSFCQMHLPVVSWERGFCCFCSWHVWRHLHSSLKLDGKFD